MLTQAETELLAEIQKHIARIEWLHNCPFEDGQPFLETGQKELDWSAAKIFAKAKTIWPDWDAENDETLFDPYEDDLDCWKAFAERVDPPKD